MVLLGLRFPALSIISAETTVSALVKGIRILETVTASGAGLSFSQIIEETGLPKGSAHRLLKELVTLSALQYDAETRRYRGGLLLATMGASVTQNYDVRRIARSHLEALHESTGSVATLGIRDGEKGIYIDKIEPADFVIRLHSEIGKSFPLHCTAMGKVLLAHSDAETVARVTRRKLRAYTENTITDRSRLRAELDTVLQSGHAIDREEITRGLFCVAAPIRSAGGHVNAAMSCTISSFNATQKRINTITKRVIGCAESASF